MFFMSMLAFATWAPGVDVEALAPRQPPLAQLLRAPRNKSKLTTLTVRTRPLHPLLRMLRKQMATKTPRLRANTKAVIFRGVARPRNV